MVYWGQIRVYKPRFGQIMYLLNFTFGKLFMIFGANHSIWPIGSYIWSLFAPIHMTTWPRLKVGKVIICPYICPYLSLFSPNITFGQYLALLFGPIHMISLPKSKLGQVGVGSNIAQSHSSSPKL